MSLRSLYKQILIGESPIGWRIAKFSDICIKIKSGGTPLTSRKEYYNNGNIPFAKIEDITKAKKYLNSTQIKITEKGLNNSNAWIIPTNSLLLAIYGSLGAVAINKVPISTNQAILGIILNEREADTEFIYYLFLYSKKYLELQAKHTTQANLTAKIIKSLKIPLPPLAEQRKIAEILSTVDEAIQRVDDAIAKTERLKQGLMQRLLTRGIGHERFKYSKELGCEVPEEWRVVRLKDVVNEVKNGFASGRRDANGIVQIRMNNVTTDGRLIFDSYLKVPIPENLDEWLLKKGDFLFNNTNSYDLVGKSTIFNEAPFPCTFSNHFTRIRFKKDLVLPELILHHFLILWKKGYFKSVAIRHVGQSAVHSKYLLKIKLPLPPLSEQQKIAEILGTVDKKLELERKRREKLERIKRGLMNDLLTGRKRVIMDSMEV